MSASATSSQLFVDHEARMTRFAGSLVGRADADDLVQDTFLKAHDHLRKGRKIRAPLSFLCVTMRNLFNDACRANRIHIVESMTATNEDLLEDAAPSVERQAISEQEFAQLCTAIVDLPERIRYAFVLRKVYGYTCREIAEQSGRSVNTVREQVAQGFKKLRPLESTGIRNP